MIFSSTHCFQILFLLAFAALNNPLTGQQNGSFENWSPSGSPPPFDWKFPTGWTTTNASTEFTSAGVVRSTDAYAGTYAAQIRTVNVFGAITRGQLALGNVKIDYPRYRLIGYTGGEALTMIPNQVSFFYKLTAGDSNEYAVAAILIKRRESGDPFPDTVYYESVYLAPASSYTEVNVSIPTEDINTETDSIVILFSSNDTNEIAMNMLYVDELSIDFVSAISPVENSGNLYKAYPNPVRLTEILNVSGPEFQKISITDLTGNVVFINTKSFDGRIDLRETGLFPGVYFINIDGAHLLRLMVVD